MNFKNFFRRNKPIHSYQDFWQWFQKKANKFHKVIKNNGDFEQVFFDPLSDKLNELKSGVYYLTGMYDDHTVELIFSADGALENMIFVEELVEAAPHINGWLFTALKPATEIEEFSIETEGYTFDGENLFFYANEHADYPDEIDLTVIHSDLNDENRGIITNGTHLFLDNFLGEWYYAAVIDNIKVVAKTEAEQELIPIRKLKSYLIWRQKEFIEKYEDTWFPDDGDTHNYNLYETQVKNETMMVALMNQDLLDWEGKASHPWLFCIEIKYKGQKNSGMPSERTRKLLNAIEDDLMEQLKPFEGILNIGRETGDNARIIYLACKDFRKPSKIVQELKEGMSKFEMDFDIYKDKYWKTFNCYRRAY